MANRHFAKLADVWKHLVLCEVLWVDRPRELFDTHAGHATYAMVNDAERRFGVLRFMEVAADDGALSRSAYFTLLGRSSAHQGTSFEYPAGPMLAMLAVGESCRYRFCDLDPESCENIRQAAVGLGMTSSVEVVEGDGMTAVHQAIGTRTDHGRACVYTDPFDHTAVGASGLSAFDVACEAARCGIGVVYWYGYDSADRRAWIFDGFRAEVPTADWWCGDIMITTPGADPYRGDLGIATSPGTGFGLVCANVSSEATRRCTELGTALSAAYEGRTIPDGRAGSLDFATLP